MNRTQLSQLAVLATVAHHGSFRKAAAELGRLLINGDTASIEPAKLKQLIRASMTLGIDTALSRLTAP